MRHWIIAILSVFAAGWALQLVGDQSPEPFRRRHPVGSVIAAGEWEKPAVIRGRREVAVSRSARPRLQIPVSRGDSYRIRIFYLLEGEAPATLRISGRRAGSLEPGPGWQRAVFSTIPDVRAGKK